jgi:hypothetical protein
MLFNKKTKREWDKFVKRIIKKTWSSITSKVNIEW